MNAAVDATQFSYISSLSAIKINLNLFYLLPEMKGIDCCFLIKIKQIKWRNEKT